MSLADLPDELIAHVASYLNYEDTCSLMETTKKNYRAIKGYRKDKMKLGSIGFYNYEDPGIVIITSKEETTGRQYDFKDYLENECNFPALTNILEQCESINSFVLTTEENTGIIIDISQDWIKLLYQTKKTKIGHVDIKGGRVGLSEDEFIDFCHKFSGSMFFDCDFGFEVLSKIVLFTVMGYGFQRPPCDYSEKSLTDDTLKALIGENGVQTHFSIANVKNSFTIKQIIRNLEIIRQRNIEELCWNFGILPASQIVDARKFFNDENEELSQIYSINVVNSETELFCMLTDKTEEDKERRFLVTFLVK